MGELRYIDGLDLDRTYTNNVVEIHKYLGVEAARSALIKEYKTVLEANGGSTNYQHWTILVDAMTSSSVMMSIDRHGMGRIETDPLARASFERQVDQLFNAAVFRESDTVKSVSSRVMLGQAIKGGTGLCSLVMNTKLLERTDFPDTDDIPHKRIVKDMIIDDIIEKDDDNAYVPD